jgi:hypothetical protein
MRNFGPNIKVGGEIGAFNGNCDQHITGADCRKPKTDAGGWIEWKGGKCPLKLGQRYEAKLRTAWEDEGVFPTSTHVTENDLHPHSYWGEQEKFRRITAYRVIA